MIINETKFINHADKVFRKLKSDIEKSFLKAIKVKTVDEFINIYTEILTAILNAEDETIKPLLNQASQEKLTEIFKTESNTVKR